MIYIYRDIVPEKVYFTSLFCLLYLYNAFLKSVQLAKKSKRKMAEREGE
jgi:hypothetical protein